MGSRNNEPLSEMTAYHILVSHAHKTNHAVLASDYDPSQPLRAFCGETEGFEPFTVTRPGYASCDGCWTLLPGLSLCAEIPRALRVLR